MSWFDATGLANIAKTALKEAQKTIDKALDIRDEEDVTDNIESKSPEIVENSPLSVKENIVTTVEKSRERKNELKSNIMPASTWGSFSGSFFQLSNSKDSKEKTPLISTQPQKSSVIVPNDIGSEGIPLAKPEIELALGDRNVKNSENLGNLGSEDRKDSNDLSLSKRNELKKNIEKGDAGDKDDSAVVIESQNKLVEDKVIPRPGVRRNSSNRNSYLSNRLSAVSTDSDGKKSTDSVEVIGSLSCATSPDTDLPSVSTSSSFGLPVNSSGTESVEVIDSLASPSSIEVLVEGTGSGRTTQSPCINSPRDENSVNLNIKSQNMKMVSSPISSVNDVSPESFEVIPDLPECDEEPSVADSYTSASESTGPTILEHSLQYSHRMAESYSDVSQTSYKFHSGESTPDVISKLPQLNKSSCDVLSESVREALGSEATNASLIKNDSVEGDKYVQTVQTTEPNKLLEDSNDVESRKSPSIQGSPSKKQAMKIDERNYWLKSEDFKRQKSDLMKSEIPKTHIAKKDFDESSELVLPSASSENDAFASEEISGSVSSYSDTRTIVANDSSCDEVVLESSSEDIGMSSKKYSAVDKLEHEVGNCYYVKNLLSEAMKEMSTTRETSPTLSEKSRSDLIKVGSEQTSGHTSGDELETTTSSDIEIISRYSPNGDSSSTTSRHSPAKLLHHNSKSKLSLVAIDILGKSATSKSKGHQREPSEASSFCSEDNFSEVEKLSKRVTELTEVLEARESRLNDLRKTNLELQEKNQELKREMEKLKKESVSGLCPVTSESEKDELIRELKEEGEKLSKKELKQATVIKTLRAHEKSQQSIIDSNKNQIQNLMKTVEDLKSELSAKKEAEKILKENVKQMNKKITRQDEEIANLLNQLEKAVVKAEEFKFLSDSRETELAKCKELLAVENFELQDAKSIADCKTKQLERLKSFQENAEIELEDLRQQLKKAEQMHSERERYNREEKTELMRRLQEAESRNEELAQSMSKATRPLLRQMEALQGTVAHERETWEKQERNLLNKLEETESRLSSVLYQEKSSKQESLELRSKITGLEEQLKNLSQDSAKWKGQVESLTKQLEATKLALESLQSDTEKQREVLKAQLTALEEQLASERVQFEAERKRTVSLQEQLKERDAIPANRDSASPRSSPTLSFGRVSLSESLSSNVWPQFSEDGFETTSISGRYSNVYDNLRANNTTSLIESLQAQLKMRDGEISHLQWELQRRDTERSALTTELTSLTSKLEEQEAKLVQACEADIRLRELQTNYDAILEMYGEKVEEAEELRLDLQDVKEMYKSQIDQLLKKEKQDVAL